MENLMNKKTIWLIVVCSLLVGCGKEGGPATYPVTGTVTYRGNPLPLGTVMFVPAKGPPSRPAAIGEDGKYQLEAVAGEHRVQVIAVPSTPKGTEPTTQGGKESGGVSNVQSLIPVKYNRFHTSGVKVEVKSDGPNQIDIQLK